MSKTIGDLHLLDGERRVGLTKTLHYASLHSMKKQREPSSQQGNTTSDSESNLHRLPDSPDEDASSKSDDDYSKINKLSPERGVAQCKARTGQASRCPKSPRCAELAVQKSDIPSTEWSSSNDRISNSQDSQENLKRRYDSIPNGGSGMGDFTSSYNPKKPKITGYRRKSYTINIHGSKQSPRKKNPETTKLNSSSQGKVFRKPSMRHILSPSKRKPHYEFCKLIST